MAAPQYCTLDGRDLGWTAAAGGASELLVTVAWKSVQVSARSRHFLLLILLRTQTCV